MRILNVKHSYHIANNLTPNLREMKTCVHQKLICDYFFIVNNSLKVETTTCPSTENELIRCGGSIQWHLIWL